ncbi:hypothetical protein WJR50_13510 [Catalinimonas sp. 4WD22]|uniref:hypothetical protein n=1 Tax=Catalinimonas locisalis TaxID=3133978 RepID=UPI003101907B
MLHLLTVFTTKRLLYASLIPMLMACGNPSEEISGTYETTVTTPSDLITQKFLATQLSTDSSAVSDQGISLYLSLYEDQRAELKVDFMNSNHDIIQKGSWELVDNQRVKIYFVEREGKYFRDTLNLRSEGLRLILRGKPNAITDDITLLKIQQ